MPIFSLTIAAMFRLKGNFLVGVTMKYGQDLFVSEIMSYLFAFDEPSL
jgi:hypothetical protein